MARSSNMSSASTIPAHEYFGDASMADEPDLYAVPAMALGPTVRSKLAWHLDPEIAKHWEFLAEALDFTMLDIENFRSKRLKSSPTKELLSHWSKREGSTIGKLLDNLTLLEREDVITDHRHLLVEDAKKWIRRKTDEASRRIQDPEIDSSVVTFSDDAEGLTLSDIGGQIGTYDAYVCYCQEDQPFVDEMMTVLEGQHKQKLFIEARDLLPGVCSTTAMAELIKNRCKRMIVILSPRFHEHELNNFCIKFGISLQPGGQSKRVVPIIVSPCSMPPILYHLTPLDYTRKDLRHWFWPRLHKAITLPL